MKRRVVVTGMGVVSPIGNTVDELWESIEQGRCGIDKITHFDTTDFKVKLAAEVKNLDMEAYFSKRDLKFNDRFTQFARIASKQAVIDSALDLEAINLDRMGVLIASGIGGIQTIETCEKTIEERGPSRVSPYFIPMALINLASGSVAIDTGARGYCSSVVTACAASNNAIGEAFHHIRDGYQDIMLAGGCEASITPLSIAGFQSMRALHTGEDKNRASIPFDKQRSGFVMGEGAGILVLEEYEHAISRKAKIYGEIIGYGMTCDAHHITAPAPDGKQGARAMQLAIEDAQIQKEDIQYINAHGTSTHLNDLSETRAIKKAFGDAAYGVKINSTKSMIGHLLGAAGGVEFVVCVKSILDGFIHQTGGSRESEEELDLNYCIGAPIEQEVTYAMSNSLGFGGHNAALLVKKYQD